MDRLGWETRIIDSDHRLGRSTRMQCPAGRAARGPSVRDRAPAVSSDGWDDGLGRWPAWIIRVGRWTRLMDPPPALVAGRGRLRDDSRLSSHTRLWRQPAVGTRDGHIQPAVVEAAPWVPVGPPRAPRRNLVCQVYQVYQVYQKPCLPACLPSLGSPWGPLEPRALCAIKDAEPCARKRIRSLVGDKGYGACRLFAKSWTPMAPSSPAPHGDQVTAIRSRRSGHGAGPSSRRGRPCRATASPAPPGPGRAVVPVRLRSSRAVAPGIDSKEGFDGSTRMIDSDGRFG